LLLVCHWWRCSIVQCLMRFFTVHACCGCVTCTAATTTMYCCYHCNVLLPPPHCTAATNHHNVLLPPEEEALVLARAREPGCSCREERRSYMHGASTMAAAQHVVCAAPPCAAGANAARFSNTHTMSALTVDAGPELLLLPPTPPLLLQPLPPPLASLHFHDDARSVISCATPGQGAAV
jgi:hypothetical protein